MAEQAWFYALTLRGEERHIFNPLPEYPAYLPSDGRALCGKLVRYLLRSQPWVDAIPQCRLCAARGATLPGQAEVAAQGDSAPQLQAQLTEVGGVLDALTEVAQSDRRRLVRMTAAVKAAYEFAGELDCGRAHPSLLGRRLRERLDAATFPYEAGGDRG